jgi:predicted nucleic acid-binding protein
VRKFVLDTNCFIAASQSDENAAMLDAFVQAAAPGLYLSTIVAAELRSSTTRPRDVRTLENVVFKPYYKRGRILNPSAAAWRILGKTLAWLVKNEGIRLQTTPRSFIFDILLAYSCRELGATLISCNERDLVLIRQVFAFESAPPYPDFG